MAASLTITFDENKYQLMLQDKQSKRTYKRLASCRSVTSLGKNGSKKKDPTKLLLSTWLAKPKDARSQQRKYISDSQ
ncbi:hypothetical protein AAC387_Pa08g1220 [Persea americana]